MEEKEEKYFKMSSGEICTQHAFKVLTLKTPTDLDLDCLPSSMQIYNKTLDQVI